MRRVERNSELNIKNVHSLHKIIQISLEMKCVLRILTFCDTYKDELSHPQIVFAILLYNILNSAHGTPYLEQIHTQQTHP